VHITEKREILPFPIFNMLWRYLSKYIFNVNYYLYQKVNKVKEDRCLQVALPVAPLLEMPTKSVTMRATTATHAGCVQRGMGQTTLSQGVAKEMLPKMTHDLTYSS